MSVVVRMEMPESCKKCKSTICLWVKGDDCDYLDVIAKVQDFRKKNNDVGFPDFCPIVCQLPEGHGRLGDLDELGRKINGARIRAMQDGQDTNPYWECGDIIAQAKTIVPSDTAERSEKDGR